jgi:hypothetical protein
MGNTGSRIPEACDVKTAFRCACVAAVAAAVLTGGCATPAPAPPAQMTLPFNAGDVAWSRASGTATVEGGAAIPGAGDLRRTCAGGEAQLFPAGPYAAEMMRIVFGSDVRGFAPLGSSRYPTNIAADFASTVRRIGCDSEGHFRFDGVPAGRWFVFSNVIFRSAGGEAPQGGALMQRLDVAEGTRAIVLLAP